MLIIGFCTGFLVGSLAMISFLIYKLEKLYPELIPWRNDIE